MTEELKTLYVLALKHGMSIRQIYEHFLDKKQISLEGEVIVNRVKNQVTFNTTKKHLMRSVIVDVQKNTPTSKLRDVAEIEKGILQMIAEYSHTIPLYKRILRMRLINTYQRIINKLFGWLNG